MCFPEMFWGLRRVEHSRNTCEEAKWDARHQSREQVASGCWAVWRGRTRLLSKGAMDRAWETSPHLGVRFVASVAAVNSLSVPMPFAVCFCSSFHQEMESSSLALNLGWPRDLLWAIEYGGNDARPHQSLGIKGLTCFIFLHFPLLCELA